MCFLVELYHIRSRCCIGYRGFPHGSPNPSSVYCRHWQGRSLPLPCRPLQNIRYYPRFKVLHLFLDGRDGSPARLAPKLLKATSLPMPSANQLLALLAQWAPTIRGEGGRDSAFLRSSCLKNSLSVKTLTHSHSLSSLSQSLFLSAWRYDQESIVQLLWAFRYPGAFSSALGAFLSPWRGRVPNLAILPKNLLSNFARVLVCGADALDLVHFVLMR